jgi:peptidoglycan/LPS O-acetylase OafA/YrhL
MAAGASPLTVVFIDALSAGAFLMVVDGAARGMHNGLGRFLGHGAVRYLGRISYSMYVVHNFLPHVLKAVFLQIGLPWAAPVSSPVQMLCLFAVSIPAAALMFHCIERPMNAIKDRVRFPAPPEENRTVVLVAGKAGAL